MFAYYFNKIPMHIFDGKAALIDYLKSIKRRNQLDGNIFFLTLTKSKHSLKVKIVYFIITKPKRYKKKI